MTRMRITKALWAELGGLRNPHLYRKQGRRGPWRYYATGPEAFRYAPSDAPR